MTGSQQGLASRVQIRGLVALLEGGLDWLALLRTAAAAVFTQFITRNTRKVPEN
jgi:hypothetical protein